MIDEKDSSDSGTIVEEDASDKISDSADESLEVEPGDSRSDDADAVAEQVEDEAEEPEDDDDGWGPWYREPWVFVALAFGAILILILFGGIFDLYDNLNVMNIFRVGADSRDLDLGIVGESPEPDETELDLKETTTRPVFWARVAEFSGSSDQQSGAFALHGGRQKLSYDISGDRALITVYIVEYGRGLNTPLFTIDNVAASPTFVDQPAGMYYVYVKSENASWSVRVDEQRELEPEPEE